MTFDGQRVLVAGGAGFIGRHLVSALAQAGAQVVVVDDFSTGARGAFDLVDGGVVPDVIDADVAVPLPDIAPCAVVFNLASPASPQHYQADPLRTWRANVYGTDQLASRALDWNAVFVQASTSEVYGDPYIHPQPETYWGHVNPIGVRSCYDEGKRAAEALIFDMVRCQGLNGRIARIFNTYGPGMDVADGRLLPNLMSQALSGGGLTVYGDGLQTRSLCFVADMVAGLMAIARNDNARGEAINLGNTQERSVLDIAGAVAALLAPDAVIAHYPLPLDDPTRRCPDITKAKAILGWEPKTTLEAGLEKMSEDFRRLRRQQIARPA